MDDRADEILPDLTPSALVRLLDALPVGAMLEDGTGRIVHVNRTLALELGIDAATFEGREPAALPLEPVNSWADGATVYRRRGSEAPRLYSERTVLDAASGLALVIYYTRPASGAGSVTLHLVSARGGMDLATGVRDREGVLARLEGEISRSRRYANPLSAVIVRVRTDLGASNEDALMRRAAVEIEAGVRWVDVVGRVSPSEFLLVLPETDDEGVARFADKLRARLVQPDEGGGAIPANVACTTWRRGEDGRDLLDRIAALIDARRGLT